uniref:Uncharacterized protein n=1 Tax=Oryza nivara TaxID=4536 RepID=A0A0E0I215_ORYNI
MDPINIPEKTSRVILPWGGTGGGDPAAPLLPPSASPPPERPSAKPAGRKDGGGGASRRPCFGRAGESSSTGDGGRQIRAAPAGFGGVATGGGKGDDEGRGARCWAAVVEGGRDGVC